MEKQIIFLYLYKMSLPDKYNIVDKGLRYDLY